MSSSVSFSSISGIGGSATSSELTKGFGGLAGADGKFDKAELMQLLLEASDNKEGFNARAAADALLGGKSEISADDLVKEMMIYAGSDKELDETEFGKFLDGLSGTKDSSDDCCCDDKDKKDKTRGGNSSPSSESSGDVEKFFDKNAGVGGELSAEERKKMLETLAGAGGMLDADELKALALSELGLNRAMASEMSKYLLDGKDEVSVDKVLKDMKIFAGSDNVMSMDEFQKWVDSFKPEKKA